MSVLVPPVRFADANGSRIAYQAFGDGDETIVAVPPAAQNIELGWECPELHHMFERFASFSRLVIYDKRGTGNSDRSSRVAGVDQRVDEIRAVMDAADVQRGHLFAQSEGGPTTLLFAATYPHRVESLTMFGSSCRVVPADLTADERAASVERRTEFARVWGTPESVAVDLFAPSRAGDADFRRWHQRYERMAASQDGLRELLIQMLDMDATGVVADLDVPMLILHRVGDRAMPIESARELASIVRDARLVELPGDDHFAYLGEIDGWMSELERFVTGGVASEAQRPEAPGAVRIRTFGRFVVEVDGSEVPTSEWGSRRARTLLKRLVVAQGWPVTRDELFELLWPDDPHPEKLGARLSVLLSGVRRVLGGGVTADRETVALDTTRLQCDLVDVSNSDDDAVVVSLYLGEFLPEDRYDDWTHEVRERTRDRFRRSARRRLERLETTGNRVAAIDLARRLVVADPYDDDAHARLIDLLEHSGDQAGALRARDARRTMLDELARTDGG